MMLYVKELRRVVFSKIFILFFAAEVFFAFFTQFWHDMGLSYKSFDPPVPGGDYGMMVVDDPHTLTQEATASLINDYINNNYTTYPYGFIHTVHLKGTDKDKIAAILNKLTGITDLDKYASGLKVEYRYDDYNQYVVPELGVLDNVSIDDFHALMTEADNILGGGSVYSPDEIMVNFSLGPMTYEEALAEYNGLINDDRITNGYARLFCDYHGIFMVLLPVFLITVYLSSDRRSKMQQLIFSRRISSVKLVMARFAALVTAEMLPVIFTAFLANVRVAQYYDPAMMDPFAMFKYSFIWILPTVVAVTGIDMLLTGLIPAVAVVIIQFGVWFMTAVMGSMSSDFGVFDLIIRHNTEMDRKGFMDNINVFAQNRLFFTALGLVCTLMYVFVWNLRREGRLGESKLLSTMSLHKS
ncbi:MAG: hypothetical protein J6M17_10995 [Ruminococcus sp.]|nr:hypothetical protein [Ruminococcus sp.]